MLRWRTNNNLIHVLLQRNMKCNILRYKWATDICRP